jgi:hypothetical protein
MRHSYIYIRPIVLRPIVFHPDSETNDLEIKSEIKEGGDIMNSFSIII